MSLFSAKLTNLLQDNDPNSPKCCFIFPLKCGIVMLGIMSLMDFLNLIRDTRRMMHISTLVTIFFAVALVFMFINCLLFLRYFLRDDIPRRQGLVFGCMCMLMANIVAFIGIVFGAIFSSKIPGSAIFNFLPTYLFPALLWFYYRMICIQWSEMGSRTTSVDQAVQ